MIGLREIKVPRLLTIRAGVLGEVAASLASSFDVRSVAVMTGGSGSTALGERLAADLGRAGSKVAVEAGLEGTLDCASGALRRLDETPVSLVVAIGGGQPIDVAKLVSSRAGIDFVAIPTALSHDGMSSPVASLVASDGLRRSVGARMPAGVVIDLDVVGGAPPALVRAGIGDLVSNITAVEDWRLAEERTGEVFDEFAASIALMSAQSALDVTWPLSEDDLALVARGLVISGLAMEVASSSRPCSGAEHLVSHALDQLRGRSAGLHGEQVALGVMVTAGLYDDVGIDRIRALFARIGLPQTLEGYGLDADTLVEAVQLAPSTRPGRHTVLNEADLSTDAVRELVASTFATELR